ncbi:hypothetical protein AMATHDRAFT_8921 [Amanita thiersii Skay4041]|uniref:Uncharacterized protein n=1 Tax=Amanita thiersii Skay4041 TaxID=703135 RepID=A0A2A9NCU9_9AGAR|nr:hypothetical protein AMATHDRAFT_8921 [Amanita thiersii Skay4041]
MSDRGYSVSPSPVGLNNSAFSTAISSLRSTYQQESASDDALHYIDSVVNSRANSPNSTHGQHEEPTKHMDTTTLDTQGQGHRSHSVTPKASLVIDMNTVFRPSSVDNLTNDGYISRTLISLPALMDKPQSLDFPSSTDPTFVLQNIFSTNANTLLQTKGYVPSVQVKDMGNALAAHIHTCTGLGFDNALAERTIQTDLLARIVAYAASELKMEIADYMIASHGSTIPLIIYREIQEDWDFSGNSNNYLLMDTTHTIQDDLDEAFTNRLHKNIIIMDSIANETALPDKWAFTDKKGHKCTTYGWLTGNDTPKKPIPPSSSFSLSIGQKRPLEAVEDTEEDGLSRKDRLDALKHHLPLPKSTVDASINIWTNATNACLDAYDLSRKEYFVNKIRLLARSKDQNAWKTFEDECLRCLMHETINLLSDDKQTTQDSAMEDLTQELSKVDLIRRTTAIWKEMAKSMWKDNILTCTQSTLDQATHLLLLEDKTHKYAQMSVEQVYDTEIDRRDQIISCITTLNENATKAIMDIKRKSVQAKDQDKVNLITQRGWETAERTILQNPGKYFLNDLTTSQQSRLVTEIINDLHSNDNHEWALKVLQDVKNKGLQAKATEHRISVIVRKLQQRTWHTSPSPAPSNNHRDQDMPLADPVLELSLNNLSPQSYKSLRRRSVDVEASERENETQIEVVQ